MSRRKTPLAEYEVYLWHRGKTKAKALGTQLGSDKLPSTWVDSDGTVYHWSATDDVEHIVIFSETDPRTARTV